jgi:hypothetical protein
MLSDKINVKEFLDSITPEQDTPIINIKDGNYSKQTYKQMMQRILKDKICQVLLVLLNFRSAGDVKTC